MRGDLNTITISIFLNFPPSRTNFSAAGYLCVRHAEVGCLKNDPNKPHARIKLMENNHSASYYLRHLLKIIPGISPLSLSFFKGRLTISKLSLFHVIIMRFAIFALPEIQKGDYLNKTAIRDWTGRLVNRLKFG
jgi:hypothetical protein